MAEHLWICGVLYGIYAMKLFHNSETSSPWDNFSAQLVKSARLSLSVQNVFRKK